MFSIYKKSALHAKGLLPDNGVEVLVCTGRLKEDNDGDALRIELAIAVTEASSAKDRNEVERYSLTFG